MARVCCSSCEAVFSAEESRYYWCPCGQWLTDGDVIREPEVAVDSNPQVLPYPQAYPQAHPQAGRRFQPALVDSPAAGMSQAH